MSSYISYSFAFFHFEAVIWFIKILERYLLWIAVFIILKYFFFNTFCFDLIIA